MSLTHTPGSSISSIVCLRKLMRLGVDEVYSDDGEHLGEVDFLRLIFE